MCSIKAIVEYGNWRLVRRKRSIGRVDAGGHGVDNILLAGLSVRCLFLFLGQGVHVQYPQHDKGYTGDEHQRQQQRSSVPDTTCFWGSVCRWGWIRHQIFPFFFDLLLSTRLYQMTIPSPPPIFGGFQHFRLLQASGPTLTFNQNNIKMIDAPGKKKCF
jgi:hypothetical protein